VSRLQVTLAVAPAGPVERLQKRATLLGEEDVRIQKLLDQPVEAVAFGRTGRCRAGCPVRDAGAGSGAAPDHSPTIGPTPTAANSPAAPASA
jgi:hypothetical protein